ncbi:hypothetical protein V8J36_12565 [Frigidibacter sp. MR17.14]|uniref:hypothetical protein n=1 Tax=Frigidibacter sp. MR17.14 TaxID=3126509 RepID=UPI003012C61F
MRHSKLFLAAILGTLAIAGCTQTDGGRAAIGAGAGALIADATDNNVLAGAALGAGAGALCDDAGICRRSY